MKLSKWQERIVQRIIESKKTVQLISAGPGVGKTEVLKHLIEELKKTNMKILYISFSRKTISTGVERIGHRGVIKYSTGHALAFKVIRVAEKRWFEVKHKYIKHLWYKRGFKLKAGVEVLNEAYAKSLIEKFSIEKRLKKKLSDSIIKYLQACYAKQEKIPLHQNQTEFKSVLCEYAANKRKANFIDFNDMSVFAWALLSEYEFLREEFHYDYIIADEAQDQNSYLLDILRFIKKKNTKLIFAGDPCQLAYSFLGARVDLFEYLRSLYPNDNRTHRLFRSYRCPREICNYSNSITSQINIVDKTVIRPLKNNQGVRPIILSKKTNYELAQFVVNEIASLTGHSGERSGGKYKYGEIVILFRALKGETLGPLYQVLKKELKAKGISFTYRREYDDEVHLYELFLSTLKVALNMSNDEDMCFAMTLLEIDKRHLKSVLIRDLRNFSPDLSLPKIVEHVAGVCRKYGATVYKKVENFFKLCQSTKCFPTFIPNVLQLYLSNKNQVTISTIHSFKGDQRKIVFLLGASDGEIPLLNKDRYPTKEYLDEERCLLNIAVSRASEILYILYMSSVFRPGEISLSRFLSDNQISGPQDYTEQSIDKS